MIHHLCMCQRRRIYHHALFDTLLQVLNVQYNKDQNIH